MTKNEALKFCIDGAKIRHEGYRPNNRIYFNGEKFLLTDGDITMDAYGEAFAHKDGWEIVPELVDFATAWAAYEAGKEIRGETGTKYTQNFGGWFMPCDIRGKWQIL